jgi:AcrR family transcriptional regulator
MSKRAAKHQLKKRELVEIAERLFLEKGYAQTSVDDILAASALSKGGFYHYFKSKEEVLSESLNYLVEDSLLLLEAIVADPTLNAMQKLRRFLTRKALFQKSKIDYAKYLGMLMKSDFMLYKVYVSLAQKFLDPFARIVEQGTREGLFDVAFPRETADILIRIMVSVPQSALYGEFVQDESTYRNYSVAVRTVIARTLGVEVDELNTNL